MDECLPVLYLLGVPCCFAGCEMDRQENRIDRPRERRGKATRKEDAKKRGDRLVMTLGVVLGLDGCLRAQ